ncbi:hypothetical protein A3G67_03545 [Candidatus Roizmanbacteria bacterium RIFCSPLOWO2_12_FULL_40_12]|uniref:Uncharacterized protein n=1 Tax=Candidatus Roizmanbacteria bacterium RIFCSPLOWO2_01_FULL_40_42 TaxID=1802066 RepID=A0A1F7J5M3_9BACT|nr:MAG: hypothetical protein A2779_03180 [Candidatus Roizmanbacteria bacterium RIFCSPHIGHO2_01_FULL_40_98]OGK28342.1 MAG: hypothetical protein A3C31_00545 [Candidatus Roizmanbacteria bacterium RIFCSPHIGHO2_02_FULL_40_53]OGK30578.1 MAG: hypothetical protein A2W49_03230 [Candidatus Roizmanbacteria bacterium RIFCSPHIGHO2_12_41_18]OGK36992.1 MAG: hypothetical protein A3E69_00805 [Candidatus Roizmanbacteria bacterium RIFCSPHIGHO2_12_FULL_40_130]OGK50898.1 MAG: hypothetical protein A3B50_01315 [Candi
MKKTKKINPYLKHLLRENAGYIAVLVALFISTIVFFSFLNSKLSENQTQISTLENDIKELQDKQSLLAAATGQDAGSLDNDVKIMQNLIPDFEDYFSILYALDTLSQKTGFLVNSYTINLGSSSTDKLSVVVSGVGNPDSFLKFLNEYNFGGGRLITSEKIELETKESDAFKLNLTFYSKKVSATNEKSLNYRTALQEFQKLKSKVSFSLRDSEVVATSESYPIKSNPF